MPAPTPDTASTPNALLVTGARLVPVTTPAPDRPVDVRVRDGVVTEVAPHLAATPGEHVLPAEGRWLIPGLWDAHVHMTMWARSAQQLDLSGTTGPEQVLDRVAGAVAHLDAAGDPGHLLVGYGYRSGVWPRPPTVVELDAVSGAHPVALISADAHSGWLSSRACRLLGVAGRDGLLLEADWFAVMPRLTELAATGSPDSADSADSALRAAMQQAAARGVVGIGDMEFDDCWRYWPAHVGRGVDVLRVRASTYPSGLAGVLAAGHRTGDRLDATGLVTMGPLKVIVDGSVNTATAYCRDPDPAAAGGAAAGSWRGALAVPPEELAELCATARRAGLQVALHAIGDAAVGIALDAVEHTGVAGSLEHVQILAQGDAPRFARLGVRASVQPAHLLDDRDTSAALWPDRQDRCFALRSLTDAGATLQLGSDAPVAPLDPWLAMAAAVHRSGDARPPWTPLQSLTPAQALAASTDGQGTVRPGSPGDLVLLDHDPLAAEPDTAQAAARLRGVDVAATVVGGRVTHLRPRQRHS